MCPYFSGPKLAEGINKSPDLSSWGTPLLLKAEIPMKSAEGKFYCKYI